MPSTKVKIVAGFLWAGAVASTVGSAIYSLIENPKNNESDPSKESYAIKFNLAYPAAAAVSYAAYGFGKYVVKKLTAAYNACKKSDEDVSVFEFPSTYNLQGFTSETALAALHSMGPAPLLKMIPAIGPYAGIPISASIYFLTATPTITITLSILGVEVYKAIKDDTPSIKYILGAIAFSSLGNFIAFQWLPGKAKTTVEILSKGFLSGPYIPSILDCLPKSCKPSCSKTTNSSWTQCLPGFSMFSSATAKTNRESSSTSVSVEVVAKANCCTGCTITCCGVSKNDNRNAYHSLSGGPG